MTTTQDTENIIQCVLISIVTALTFTLLFVAVFFTPPPRLVGYGCEGSSGPLYANEEDHFPKCESIVEATE